MNRRSFAFDLEREIARSSNYKLNARIRSAIRHDLVSEAMRAKDDSVWKKVAYALIAACDRDDLTPQVSDRFVMHCPEEVFMSLGKGITPYYRFREWRRRFDAGLK